MGAINNDVIKAFWLLSRNTGFMEGGSFNLRRRRMGEEGEIRAGRCSRRL